MFRDCSRRVYGIFKGRAALYFAVRASAYKITKNLRWVIDVVQRSEYWRFLSED